RRWRSRTIATLAVALLVASCSNGDDSDADRPAGPDAAEDELTIGLPGAVEVDPSVASLAEPSDLLTVDLLYDGLTELDEGGNPVPALAESWQADAEQLVWRFQLDPERTFASGRPITANDV